MRPRHLIATGGRRALVALACAATPALTAAAPAPADWPVYGHDLANSRDGGTAGPSTSQVPSMPQAWQFKSPTGDFTGTPVVAGGVLVAGDNGGSIYALNAVTGNVLWTRRAVAPITGTAAIDLGAPGGPAVYVPIAQQGSPRLLALSLASGATRWQTVLTNQANSSVFGSPTVWNGTVYIGTSGPNEDTTTARGSVVAVNEANGAVRWQTFTVPPGHDGAAVWSTPAIDPGTGRLYVGTGNNYHPPTTSTEDSMMALNAANGQVVGHFQATTNDSFDANDNPAGPDFDFGASPNLIAGAGGRQLVGEGQKSGTYWALDRATMKPVWSTSVGPGGPLGGILGSTAYDGTRIYGADTSTGSVFALTTSGASAWQSADAGGLHLGSPTVAHGVLYTTDPSGLLTARDAATGQVLNKLPLGGPAFGGISVVGRAVYVAVGTGPAPKPAPQNDSSGSIVAFGDTSQSGGSLAGAGGAAGAGATGGTVLPANTRCVASQRLRFKLRDRGGRIVRVALLVNGRRRLVLRRRGHRRITIRVPRGRSVVVAIVVTRRDGTKTITTRRYSGCGVSRVHRRVRHRHRRRR